jgi:prephenate dehydrogenase
VEHNNTSVDKIAIIGLGLIGGSIGLALKTLRKPKVEIVGFDLRPSQAKRASKMGAIDRAAKDLRSAVENAGLVILAVPILAIRDNLEAIGPLLIPGSVVTDTGSTKEAVLHWAEQYLPDGISFVGGHPMAGKEESGIQAAVPNLFVDRRYCVIPGKNADQDAVKAVTDLVLALKAKPYFLDAVEHDSYVAAVSHLPIVLSAALVSSTQRSPSWREMSKLAATGYRDVSRLASGDPIMNLDICLSNQESLTRWIDYMITELSRYRTMIANGEPELAKELENVHQARNIWLHHFTTGIEEDKKPRVEPPSVTDILLGEFTRRYTKLFDFWEKKQQKGPRK